VSLPTAHSPRPTAHVPRPTSHGQRPTAHGPRPTAHGPRPLAPPTVEPLRGSTTPPRAKLPRAAGGGRNPGPQESRYGGRGREWGWGWGSVGVGAPPCRVMPLSQGGGAERPIPSSAPGGVGPVPVSPGRGALLAYWVPSVSPGRWLPRPPPYLLGPGARPCYHHTLA
jgi:hypothetical protein